MHSGNAQKLVHNIVRIGERGYCIYIYIYIYIYTVLMCYKSQQEWMASQYKLQISAGVKCRNGWHVGMNDLSVVHTLCMPSISKGNQSRIHLGITMILS